MAASWYYAINGEKAGPLNLSEIQQLAASGILKPSDLVWKEGLPAWIPAREAKELRITLSQAAVSQEPVSTPAIRLPQRFRELLPFCLFSGLAVLVATVLVIAFRPGGKPVSTEQTPEKKVAQNATTESKLANAGQTNVPDAKDARLEEHDGNGSASPKIDDGHVLLSQELNIAAAQHNPANGDEVDNVPVDEKINWRKFRHPKGVVEVEMPAEAVFNRDNGIIPPPPGTFRFSTPPPAEMNLDHPTNYTARVGDLSCSLKVAKLAPFTITLIAENPRDFVDLAKADGDVRRWALKNESDFPITSERALQLGNARGIEFQINLPQSIVVARWYMTMTHEFWASIVLPKNRDTTIERSRFFNSLKLTGTSSAEPTQIARNGNPAAPPNGVPVPANEPAAAMNPAAEPNDGIPQKIREYFERAERIRLSRLKSLEKEIEQLRFDVMNAPPHTKAQKRRQLTIIERARDELESFRKPTGPLPVPMEIGDIGYMEVVHKVSIWDTSTITGRIYVSDESVNFHINPNVIVDELWRFRDEANHEFMVINVQASVISKTKTKDGDWPSKSLFRVIATSPDDKVLSVFPESARKRMKDHIVLEPVKTLAEIEKYQDLFYRKKHANPAK